MLKFFGCFSSERTVHAELQGAGAPQVPRGSAAAADLAAQLLASKNVDDSKLEESRRKVAFNPVATELVDPPGEWAGQLTRVARHSVHQYSALEAVCMPHYALA
jgi:hypothetical protein